MKISALKEKNTNEMRVSISPDSIGLFKRLGFEVIVEEGAGANSGYPDHKYLDFEDLGSIIVEDGDSLTVNSFEFPLEHIYIYYGIPMHIHACFVCLFLLSYKIFTAICLFVYGISSLRHYFRHLGFRCIVNFPKFRGCSSYGDPFHEEERVSRKLVF